MPSEAVHPSSDHLENMAPEEAWMLYWARRPKLRPSSATLQAAAGKVRSWKRVLKVAHQNGLAPLLASNGRGTAVDAAGIPQWVVQDLEQRRLVCLARSAQVVFHLAPLLKDLHEAGVATMVLKGALLAETLYADPGARSFFDVDLLVNPEDVPRAHQVLERHLYSAIRPVDLSRPPQVGGYLNSILYGGRKEKSPLIHLHWHLVNTSMPSDDFVFQVGMAQLWAEAEKLELWDVPVLAPEPHHLLIQLSQHAYDGGFKKLTRLVDVAWACPVDANPAFWERVLQVAHDWGLATPCYCSLFLCRGLGLAPVPAEIVARLRPAGRHRLADRILRGTLRRPGLQSWDKLLYLAHRPGLAGKLRFVAGTLCPPMAEVEAIYGQAPGSLRALGYLRYVARRLAVALRKGWAALRRL